MALVAALVLSSALAPPELSPTGSALAVTLAAGLGVLLLLGDGRARAWAAEDTVVALVVSAYLGVSVLSSSQPHRSLSCLLGPGIALVACLAVRREAAHPGNRDRILKAFVTAASLVAGHGRRNVQDSQPFPIQPFAEIHILEPDGIEAFVEAADQFPGSSPDH